MYIDRVRKEILNEIGWKIIHLIIVCDILNYFIRTFQHTNRYEVKSIDSVSVSKFISRKFEK